MGRRCCAMSGVPFAGGKHMGSVTQINLPQFRYHSIYYLQCIHVLGVDKISSKERSCTHMFCSKLIAVMPNLKGLLASHLASGLAVSAFNPGGLSGTVDATYQWIQIPEP